jgi:hypothetical protein
MALPPVAWPHVLATAAEDARQTVHLLEKSLLKSRDPHNDEVTVQLTFSHVRDFLVSLKTIDCMKVLSAKGPLLRKPHLNLLCMPLIPDAPSSRQKNGPR